MPGHAPLATGTTLINRYRIIQLLGQGGFGAVYRAWDQNLNRPCAVKENTDSSFHAAKQFSQEATLLANLNHPNLPRVTDHFSIPSQGQYLVMDYVEGEDLRDMLDRSFEPLAESEVIPWVLQICDALIYLHSQPQPIIHRDIKPSNIRITPHGKAMLVDFGIAKVYDPQLRTTSGAKALTPGYSPPEQYGQGTTDARSDIYALGATLYTMLSGNKPPDSVDMLTGIAPFALPVHDINPKISPQLSEAIEKCMELDRNLRYQSVEEFKEALIATQAARRRTEQIHRAVKPLAGVAILIFVALMIAFIGRSCSRGITAVFNPGTPSVIPIETAIYLRTLSPQAPAALESLTPLSMETDANGDETPGAGETLSETPAPTEAFLIYVREGPGRDFAWVGGIRNETRFDVVGRNAAGDWLFVRLDSGLEGWVFGDVLKYYTPYSGDGTQLPVNAEPTLFIPEIEADEN